MTGTTVNLFGLGGGVVIGRSVVAPIPLAICSAVFWKPAEQWLFGLGGGVVIGRSVVVPIPLAICSAGF